MEELRVLTADGFLTLDAALKSELDILPTLTGLNDTIGLRDDNLDPRRHEIIDVVARHLNIPSTKFVLSQSSKWIFGGFNICLQIEILDTLSGRLPRKAMLRIALPHALGDSQSSDTVDEKVRCEAATYIWLERDCPSVPIPRLLGVGFPGSTSFSRVETESWLNWTMWHACSAIAWWQGKTLPRLFAYNRMSLQDMGYLLIEHVEDGEMLSSSWKEHRHDPQKRKNLYRGLATIMLEMSNAPLPRIGSWTMNNQGIISLTNRPFNVLNAFWSRHKIPLNVPRNLTYSTTQSYVQELLAYQDVRMQHQLNSIISKDDGIHQLVALVGLRAILPQLYNSRSSRGKFVMTFTDLHQSNIFVDEDWNITRLIDLEFAHSCPIELVNVPHWLSSRGVDELGGPDLEEYKILHDQFIEAVVDREMATKQTSALSRGLREDWTTGRIWFSMALGSLNAFPTIYAQHLRPRYFRDWLFERDAWPLAQLWTPDVSKFLEMKINGLQEYQDQVRRVFGEVERSQEIVSS